MEWVTFACSLASKSSSPRVALWRRLRRLGAISPAGGLYVLPSRPECIESFTWLAQEIRQAKGDAIVMRADRFEGMEESQLAALFNAARQEDYRALGAQITSLEKRESNDPSGLENALERVRRQYAEILRVDYFNCPDGLEISSRLAALASTLAMPSSARIPPAIPAANRSEYQDRIWITRPRPQVDRLACAWLIRRFIDSRATIRYARQSKPGEVAFDTDDSEFGHVGGLCSFETMCRAFGFDDAGLRALAEIVHEIDLRDGRFTHPVIAGVSAILDGWLRAVTSDAELEEHGLALFEGLYRFFTQTRPEPSIEYANRKRKGDST
jgi:hypothetical protein